MMISRIDPVTIPMSRTSVFKVRIVLPLVLGLAVLNFVAVSTGAQDLIDFDRLNSQLLSIITNKEVADTRLLQAISRLGPVTEPASFWTRIANDPSYSLPHRRRAVFALLRRHCSAGMTCSELADIISPADWARSCVFQKWDAIIGWIPILPEPGQTIYSVSVLGGSEFFVRLEGDVDASVLKAYLSGDGKSQNSNPAISAIAFADDYDDWLFQRHKQTGTSSSQK